MEESRIVGAAELHLSIKALPRVTKVSGWAKIYGRHFRFAG
jgi:hypothetical protein